MSESLNKIPVIAVVGPTASGKTAFAVALAKKIGAEIVSADSMQIYKGMDIASAKPTTEEMQGIPHHLMGFLELSERALLRCRQIVPAKLDGELVLNEEQSAACTGIVNQMQEQKPRR